MTTLIYRGFTSVSAPKAHLGAEYITGKFKSIRTLCKFRPLTPAKDVDQETRLSCIKRALGLIQVVEQQHGKTNLADHGRFTKEDMAEAKDFLRKVLEDNRRRGVPPPSTDQEDDSAVA